MLTPVCGLPHDVEDLCAALARIRGVEAVAIGGSQGTGTADAGSDWDLGVYYRGSIDLRPLARYGEVHPPGSWGRIMNGGAWLTLGGVKIDVMLRDIDIARYWSARARRGSYKIDALLGYVAGVPTYTLMAELAVNKVIYGRLPTPKSYPLKLSQVGERRWRLHAEFSLAHAQMRAERGDVIGTVGQSAKAVIELAHALACARHLWVVNEKKLIERSGLQDLRAQFTHIPAAAQQLMIWLDGLRSKLKEL
jgi:Nucleotidyltransferase domain